MNVYDFDETVFTGDCEIRFFKWLSEEKGFRFYGRLFKLLDFFSKKHAVFSRTFARQIQYSFLKRVDDIDALLEEYWDMAQQYMKPWYLAAKKPDDIIATGSPEFLMMPILKRLGLSGIVATDMDKHSGKINGKFTVCEHKVTKFHAKFKDMEIDKFYSDSYTDHFLADIAKEAYVVLPGDVIQDWNEYYSVRERRDLRA